MSQLFEIYGDTVDSRDVGRSVLFAVALASVIYVAADQLFAAIEPKESLARSYTLLTGLVGCVVAGFLIARRVEPKRRLVADDPQQEEIQAVVDELRAEFGELGDPSELPIAVQRELSALNLYQLFASAHAASPVAPTESAR